MTEAEMYEKMFSIVCRALSRAVDKLEEMRLFDLRDELQEALDKAEEIIYMNLTE